MQVSPTVSQSQVNLSSAPTSAPSSTASTTATGSQTLGINDFMQLLATQFQEQDPLKPMDDTAFIAQTAQFTALQQATTLTQQVTQMAANDYIGRSVAVNNSAGQTTYGTVSGVDTSGSTPNLIINGGEYPLSSLLGIQPPTAGSTTTPATPTAPATGSTGSAVAPTKAAGS
jgi:flagellar basal-body rod modification protein FlgD